MNLAEMTTGDWWMVSLFGSLWLLIAVAMLLDFILKLNGVCT